MKGTLALCPYWSFWKIFRSNFGDEPQEQSVLFSLGLLPGVSRAVSVQRTPEGLGVKSSGPPASVGSTQGLSQPWWRCATPTGAHAGLHSPSFTLRFLFLPCAACQLGPWEQKGPSGRPSLAPLLGQALWGSTPRSPPRRPSAQPLVATTSASCLLGRLDETRTTLHLLIAHCQPFPIICYSCFVSCLC